jgi:uncharacterized membrane protein SpoIIM required for sporulation
VDIDRYIAANEPVWVELENLAHRATRHGRSLTPYEVDRLVQLYQRASAHLSFAQTHFPGSGVTGRLSRIVGNASAAIYSTRARAGPSLVRFFTTTFPGAVWHIRRFVAVSALLTFVPAIAIGVWLANSDTSRDSLISKQAQESIAASEFEDYYSSAPAGAFSTHVLVNNIGVSFLAFAAGIQLCVVTAFLLFQNGANVGVLAGVMHAANAAPTFWGLILPHGLLELSAIVISGGAGFTLGWAIVAPGDRTRAAALVDAARRSVTVLIGLMLAFVIAGLIEGFVTPSDLPTSARVGLGIAVSVAFWIYIVTRGRAAASAGFSGVLGEQS